MRFKTLFEAYLFARKCGNHPVRAKSLALNFMAHQDGLWTEFTERELRELWAA